MSFESINTYCDKSMLYTLKVLKRLHLGKTVNALLRKPFSKKSDLIFMISPIDLLYFLSNAISVSP